MEALLMYIIKVCAGVVLLFGVYVLLLKREKFFQLNRLVLIIAITLPFFLPLLPASPLITLLPFSRELIRPDQLYDHSDKINAENIATAEENNRPLLRATSFPNSLSWQQVIAWVYVGIALTGITKLVYRVMTLMRSIRTSEKVMIHGTCCHVHDDVHPPFSFLHFIVINRAVCSGDALRSIILHEKVHMRQWHTIDILLAESIHALLWINPLMPSIKKHIRLNHEYLADDRVLAAGINKQKYQLSMLDLALSRSALPLINRFTSSKIKNRIAMMNTRKSPVAHLYKYAFVALMIGVIYTAVNPAAAHTKHTFIDAGTAVQQDLAKFDGYYQFEQDKEMYIRVLVKNNELVLKQLWDHQQIVFTRNAELEFSADHSFTLVFSKNEKGEMTKVVAFGRDV